MDNMKSRQDQDREELVRRLGLRIKEVVVREVVEAILGRKPLYDLQRLGIRRDGTARMPICGKGTVYKIKRLLETGGSAQECCS